jgi:alcohol dehydrogenase
MEKLQQVVHLRENAIAELEVILREHSTRKPFFVVDELVYSASGAADILDPVLSSFEAIRFNGFEPNPKLSDVERGIEMFRKTQPDIIIAFGGGTAIDLAKLIGSIAVHDISSRDIITGVASIEQKGPALVVIPTTAGTGSEATHFAVAYVDGVKFSVAHENLLPDIVLLDPQLTYNLPSRITAASGLDAFCQAVESIWAVGATDESVEFATLSVKLSLEHLAAAVNDPTPKARRGMCEAAHLAGKAINISKTTAPHAISYAITTHFGVPHGIAVALTLGPMLEYNSRVKEADCNDPRGCEHVQQRIAIILDLLGGDLQNGLAVIKQLIDEVGGVRSLCEIGASSIESQQLLATQVNPERLSNNPRMMNATAIERIFLSITDKKSNSVTS